MGRRVALTPEQVQQILLNPDKLGNKDFAALFEVSIGTILNVKAGRSVYGKNSTEG